MSAILRMYDLAECGSHGVPLDFEKCRTCDGIGSVDRWGPTSSRIPERLRCPTCDGHGSLKAAALPYASAGWPVVLWLSEPGNEADGAACVCPREESGDAEPFERDCPIHGEAA